MTEALWRGSFGNDYAERNPVEIGARRGPFWAGLLSRYPVKSVLEVGCGVGANLQHLRSVPMLIGLDVNEHAVDEARCLGVRAIVAPATDIPYPDASFDLVFTSGLLIHLGDAQLLRAMDEMYRVSSRYLLAIEYESEAAIDAPYRGHTGALWRRPYGRMIQERFPTLILRETGFLSGPVEETGWDHVTYWMFERP